MSHLIDVSLLIACGWASHENHVRANRWLDRQDEFFTAPSVQMGFLRVSMCSAYGATYDEASKILSGILTLSSHHFVSDSIQVKDLPLLTSRHDVSDAHLVSLAKHHRLKFATLDNTLCQKLWAASTAINPLLS
jgi:predicted nucleic acid-binding protein